MLPPRAFVFGVTGPVALADLPPGRFRDQVLALPAPARALALAALGDLRVPINNLASLHADDSGALFFVCPRPPGTLTETSGPTADASLIDATPPSSPGAASSELFSVSVPASTPPLRHSRPGAARVLYLDFNGHTVAGTSWNNGSGAAPAYVCTAYDTNGNFGSFNPAEQAAILLIWERVAESFRPYDVDVTTEEPAVFNNRVSRVLITKARDANAVLNPSADTASGVAFLNGFGNSNFATATGICFVYQDNLTPSQIAGVASHEIGHQMGLSHDGTVGTEYYAGHGGGETSWSPIMGSGRRNVVQWSKGEYLNANNPQDDLAIIAGKLTFRADDATPATVAPLVADGAALQLSGVLEITDDTDTFAFTTAGGPVALAVSPPEVAGFSNLYSVDLVADLRDATGNVVARSAPADSVSSTLNVTLPAGAYTLRVSSDGTANPLASPPTGYTAYGSVGSYRITGTVPPPANPVAAAIVRDPEIQNLFPGNPAAFSVVARGNPAVTYAWQRSTDAGRTWTTLANTGPFSGATTATLAVAAVTPAMRGDTFRCSVGNSAGSATSAAAALAVAPLPPAALPVFDPVAIAGSFGRAVPAGTTQSLTATLTGGSDPITLRWQLDGVDLPGTDNPVYFLTNWQPANSGLYRVVASNAAGTVTSPAFSPAVHPEGGWQWRHPLPTGNGLTRTAFLNGRFFIGGLRGTVLTSVDGAEWTRLTLPAANNIFGFRYFNNLYVALGSLGSVFTSPDGEAWTPRSSGVVTLDTGTGLQGLAVGNGRIVAVGLKGVVTTSRDGVAWTAGTIGTPEDLFGVAFAFGRFHAVSGDSGRVFSSADGLAWTSVNTATSGSRALTAGNSRLVAVGPGGATLVSTDGLAWTVGNAATSDSLVGVDFVNQRYVAVGANGAISTSPDGLAWTAANSGGNRSNLQSTAYGNGVYVTVGQSGTSGRALLVSTDGDTWRESIAAASGIGVTLRGLASGGDTLVAVGNSGTVLRSVAGSGWTARPSGTAAQLNAVDFGAGRFVAVGAGGVVLTSNDGATWSSQSLALTLNGVRFLDNLWVAVGTSGRIHTSPNGTSWTQRFAGTTTLNKVAFGAGRFVAVGATGSLVTSTEGVAWNVAAGPTTENLADIVFGAGRFVAVGARGTVLVSPDGLAWTTRSVTSEALSGLAFVSGQFIATGAGNAYYVSSDGLEWSARFTGASDPMLAVTARGEDVFIAGENSGILSAGVPRFTSPATRVAVAGNLVVLGTTVAASAFNLSYQWFKDGVALPGATGATLDLRTVTAASAGLYSLRLTGPQGIVATSPALLTVTPLPSGPTTGRLANVSVRANLGVEQIVTVGFNLAGGTKSVLLRAAGPALATLGVEGAMADPRLALFDGAALVTTNNDWANQDSVSAAGAALGAFPFLPDSRDAALLTEVAGGRTLQVSGPAAGLVVVEAYDAGSGDSPRLTNISARNQVGTGANILIAGFSLTGTKTLLIRAVGPTLAAAPFNLPGTLADPSLELFTAATIPLKIAENDTWSPALASSFSAVGAFALAPGSRDAALLVTLAPGGYTVQVSGVGNTTGQAIVEIYEVP